MNSGRVPPTPPDKARGPRCIEGSFPVEWLSEIAQLESWRKEIHRPIYHMHKWWAQRLGSVFRAIILGSALPRDTALTDAFYARHDLSNLTIYDPFAGSGTTLGEGLKLGCRVAGRDINPVATRAITTALGPIDRAAVESTFESLQTSVAPTLRDLYRGLDRQGQPCDVLYHFWVKTLDCPQCDATVDLFRSYVFARHAYPQRHPEGSILCPECAAVFRADVREPEATCPACDHTFDPHRGPAQRTTATCRSCHNAFKIAAAAREQGTPGHRQYAKLVLDAEGRKDYLPATDADRADYAAAAEQLARADLSGTIPDLPITDGHNTRQVLGYGYRHWSEFFNARQLLGLATLGRAIAQLPADPVREVFATLFSGVLEFNNMFASFKGEGTGAVRHMFSHHILKPERTPLEANLWGTPKSSGSFCGLYRGRVLRALDYRDDPTELRVTWDAKGKARAVKVGALNHPIGAQIVDRWPEKGGLSPGQAYVACGDSGSTDLPDRSVDLVITDPPFFDNVHYSELADFFHAWQRVLFSPQAPASTRQDGEVQDADAGRFADKLARVLAECHRVLVDDGLLVLTYHHSRDDGWLSLARAIGTADFRIVAAHPVKAEMSGATPKSQARAPIDLDSILVCRKRASDGRRAKRTDHALSHTQHRTEQLLERFGTRRQLSTGDLRVIITGELLAQLSAGRELTELASTFETMGPQIDQLIAEFVRRKPRQLSLF